MTPRGKTYQGISRVVRLLWIVSLIGLGLILPACQPPVEATWADAVPSDFSVSIQIINRQNDPAGIELAANPLRQSARYLLQSNRRIHMAIGQDSSSITFPPPVRTIHPQEVRRLYRIVADNHLMAEPTSPMVVHNGDTSPRQQAQVIYCIELTSLGRTQKYMTTAVDSPATVHLLIEMINLVTPGRLPEPASL